LIGCSPKTQPVSIGVYTTAVFSASGQDYAPNRWWTAFEDQKLNSLVDTALHSNFNLKTTWERLQAAQAVVDREAHVKRNLQFRFFGLLNGKSPFRFPKPERAGSLP